MPVEDRDKSSPLLGHDGHTAQDRADESSLARIFVRSGRRRGRFLRLRDQRAHPAAGSGAHLPDEGNRIVGTGALAEVRIVRDIEACDDASREPAALEDAVLRLVVLIGVLPERGVVGVQIRDLRCSLVLNEHPRGGLENWHR